MKSRRTDKERVELYKRARRLADLGLFTRTEMANRLDISKGYLTKIIQDHPLYYGRNENDILERLEIHHDKFKRLADTLLFNRR